MNALIIEPANQDDYRLFIDLAKRLPAKFTVRPSKDQPLDQSGAQSLGDANEHAFPGLCGTPEGVDAESLIKMIEESRTTKEIGASWVE